MLGVSREALLNADSALNKMLQFVHPEDRAEYLRTIEETAESHEPYESEFRAISASGDLRHFIEAVEPVFENGAFTGRWRGVTQDLNDIREAEERLRIQAADQRVAGDLSLLGHWEYDLATDQIKSTSETYAEILGVPLETVENGMRDQKEFVRLVHPDDREAYLAKVIELGGAEGSYEFVFRIIRPIDGQVRFVIERGMPIRDEEGKIFKFRGALQDITDEKQREEELENALRQAKAASSAKSEFLATISHELRTPLTSSLGSMKIVKNVYADQLPEKAAEMIDLAIRNEEGLLVPVNDLLDFEKAMSGRFAVNCQPHDIRALTEDTVEKSQGYAHSSSVTFDLMPTSGPVLGRVDEQRFDQVLSNLLSNAAKFSSEGSSIQIEVLENVETVGVRVKDTGIGIPKLFHEAVFDPFTQVEDSMTRSHKGTGLGLPICKALTEAMGGRISLESEEGAGSTFTVTFPKASAV